jgi:NAD(P)H-nitrite reductase large subunit
MSDRPQPRAALVGAGFIGFIVLGAMWKRGWNLTVVEREPRVLPRMLDAAAADYVEQWLERRQVAVHTRTSLQAIEPSEDGRKRLQFENGSSIEADLVILATGIRPNMDLAAGSAIATDQGILVDHHLRTSVPNVFAAGDVAQGPALLSDEKQIHAIQPTAVDHGRVAGANMAGREVRYPGSLSMNVVDVCGLQCASFGHWQDNSGESTTISNPAASIYRKLVWRGDQLIGAMFTGRAEDVGMLTDVGMVKGMLQSQIRLGPWKEFLQKNPFDVRRAYVGAGVAQKLVNTSLLGDATPDRRYRFEDRQAAPAVGTAHSVFSQSFGN